MKRRTLLLAFVLSWTGCGYGLSGGTIPESLSDVAVIAVMPFDNRTDRSEIDQRVTEEVARELTQRGRRFRVVTDPRTADAVLSGAVVNYRTNAVAFTPTTGRTSRVESVVTVQAVLRKTEDDTVLWSQSGLLFREQFDVPESGEFFDRETLALDLIAAGVADVVVTSILEGW